jgi:SpoIID/LytB domain protein
VVAGEVKALAQQTARATEDIARQIGAIQAETHSSVAVIEGVGRTIANIAEVTMAVAAAVEQQAAATREISLEAHGSLGASMSQHGAQELAQQGMTYNAILGHYYQGASLARLRSGAS